MGARLMIGPIGAAAMALIAACGSGKQTQSDAEICEQILSSFAAVPITPQSREQALERIEFIKVEQEASFAKRCDKIPGWRAKFDTAYEEARAATKVIIIESVEAAPVGSP